MTVTNAGVGVIVLVGLVAGCGAAQLSSGRAQEVEKARAAVVQAFEADRPADAEWGYGDLLQSCSGSAKDTDDCVRAIEAVERAKQAMWRAWEADPAAHAASMERASLRSAPLPLATVKCLTEARNTTQGPAWHARCDSIVKADRAGLEDKALLAVYEELKARLDRGAPADLRGICWEFHGHLETPVSDPGVQAVKAGLVARCTDATAAARLACDEDARARLAAGNTTGLLAAAQGCSNAVYDDVARAELARADGAASKDAACVRVALLESIRHEKVTPAVESQIRSELPGLRTKCGAPALAYGKKDEAKAFEATPYSPDDYAYGSAPAMLERSSPGYHPSSTSPSSRPECDTFSASGKKSTYYQTNCRR